MIATKSPARAAARGGRAGRALILASLGVGAIASPGRAQTDYYNLDRGRPLRIEDALVIERHALEWQLAPLRISGGGGAGSSVEIEPEVAWGVWPRTQLEVGVPIARARRGGATSYGGAGIDVALLHALNVESVTLPALALGARLLLPTGPFGPSRAIPTLSAIATRTFSAGRLHLNASATPGAAAPIGRVGDASRWDVGIGADHAFVFRALLVGADLVARRPLAVEDEVEWSASTGVRYQVGPRTGIDVGVGRTLGNRDEWFVTVGSAVSLALLHRFGGVR